MLQKLIDLFKELGPLVGVFYLINKCLMQVSPNIRVFCHAFMVQPISEKPLLPDRMKKSYECHEIKRGDPCLNLMPPPPEIIDSRFNQNAICLGVFKKDEFIGYIWFNYNNYKEDETRCLYLLEQENTSVFDYDFYIFPKHRMGLAFIVIWDGANKFLRKRGITQTFSRLTQSNITSKKAHDHLGWKRAGQAFYLKLWRFEFMFATIYPYLGFSFRESGRINIKLNADALKRTSNIL